MNNIHYTIIDNATNEYVRHGACHPDALQGQAKEWQTLIEGWFMPDDFYFESGAPVAKGAKPSQFHDWSEATKEWSPMVTQALADRKRAIEDERERRCNLPLFYDGKLLDADERSRKNIQNKITEIESCNAIGITVSTMFWRDADNVEHSWSDVGAFKAWLQGFVATMGVRTTANYGTQFAHKNALETLSSGEDQEAALMAIMNHDITTGWQ